MITKTTVVRGSIVGNDGAQPLKGKLKPVRIDGALTIGDEASLKVNVSAASVALNGQIEGIIESESTFVMTADAVSHRDRHHEALTVAEGAKLKGRIEMDYEI